MMHWETTLKLAFTLTLAFALVACDSNPTQPASPSPPKAEIQFMDLQGFDRDLAGSLSAPLPKVEVGFYDRIAPSALPERIQRWMASVEAGGGKVKVVPPNTGITAKDPFLLISLITSLWSGSKMVKEVSAQAQFKAAEAYDAEIILKQDDKSGTVVDKVVFVQRKK